MCNDSDAYRKVNKHHIAQKNPMLTVSNQIDDKNIRRVNQVSPLKWQGLKYNEDSQFSY